MDRVLREVGVDWAVECSAADAAAFASRTEKGQSQFLNTARYLAIERHTRSVLNPQFDSRELISVRFQGKKFAKGKVIAQKIEELAWSLWTNRNNGVSPTPK